MRSIFMVIFVLIFILSGCQSEAEKQAELQLEQERQLNEQIATLTQHAQEYEREGDLLKIRDIYEEIVSLKPSSKNRKMLDDVETEIYNAKQTKVFFDGLYDIEKNRLRSGISVSAIELDYISKDIRQLMNEFQRLDTTADNDINLFIEKIKNDKSYVGYSWLKEYTDPELYENSSTIDMLGEIDPALGMQSTMLYALYRENILDGIDAVLSKKIPSRYSKVVNE
ncbi:hypothetical protein MHH70_17240 [Metasolibacillus sp. FSL H7-0170]|uniref:hypothetical protein n=1 Tax=Metasolibacillus sp. FSL H7-0170 TaxID=2921431 RepID=UPI00315830A5